MRFIDINKFYEDGLKKGDLKAVIKLETEHKRRGKSQIGTYNCKRTVYIHEIKRIRIDEITDEIAKQCCFYSAKQLKELLKLIYDIRKESRLCYLLEFSYSI